MSKFLRITVAICSFFLFSQFSFAECIFNENVKISKNLETQLLSILGTETSINFIAELVEAGETPESLLPSKENYDLNNIEEVRRYSLDRKKAEIAYAQSFYSPFLEEFSKIDGLIVPKKEVWTISVMVLTGNANAICEASHVEGVLSLLGDGLM